MSNSVGDLEFKLTLNDLATLGITNAKNALNLLGKEGSESLKKLAVANKQAGGDITNAMSASRQSVMAFSQGLQDSSQFQMGFGQGVRAISNNIDFFINSLGNVRAASGSWKGAISAMGQSLMGVGGLLVALNLVTTAIQIFSQSSVKDTAKAKEEAEKYTAELKKQVELQKKLHPENRSKGISDLERELKINAELQAMAREKTEEMLGGGELIIKNKYDTLIIDGETKKNDEELLNLLISKGLELNKHLIQARGEKDEATKILSLTKEQIDSAKTRGELQEKLNILTAFQGNVTKEEAGNYSRVNQLLQDRIKDWDVLLGKTEGKKENTKGEKEYFEKQLSFVRERYRADETGAMEAYARLLQLAQTDEQRLQVYQLIRDANAEVSEEYQKQEAAQQQITKELEKQTQDALERISAPKESANEQMDTARRIEQLNIDLLQDGVEKRKKQASIEKSILLDKWAFGKIGEEEYKLSVQKIDRDSAKKEVEIAELTEQAKLDAASNAAGILAGIFGEQTAAYKIFSITQATIEMYKGATAALSPPPIGAGPLFGPILAGATIASGLANIAKISAAAGGGDFITNGKTNLIVGDNPGGRELVSVRPLSGSGKTYINPASGLSPASFSYSANDLSPLINEIRFLRSELRKKNMNVNIHNPITLQKGLRVEMPNYEKYNAKKSV